MRMIYVKTAPVCSNGFFFQPGIVTVQEDRVPIGSSLREKQLETAPGVGA